MSSLRLADTHVHFWDPQRLRYSWLRDHALLDRRYGAEDYPTHGAVAATEACVFIECDADPGQSLEEIQFVEEQAKQDPRIRAIVAHAPLERGGAIEPLLEEIVHGSSKVRGIRRILQAEIDLPTLLLSSTFIEGVRRLRKFGLHFEITVTHHQMDCVLEFVQKVPEIPMVLDHCGKPGIRHALLDAFKRHVGELARHPNVHCKLSGLATEAEHGSWTEAQLLPYIDAALQAFGPDRLLYGSDWPVCLQATSVQRWIDTLERALTGCSQEELRRVFRDNANTLYRLGLSDAAAHPDRRSRAPG
jgi:predicted TIM-barrel fold metal-dependent hydrolase